MPFPLAHPAAILPLRRFCPRRLSFCALFVGSLVPDFGYAMDDLLSFPRFLGIFFGHAAHSLEAVQKDWEWSDFSHSLWGSVGFCLPMGVLVLWVFLSLRTAFVTLLPNPFREVLRPLCVGRPFLFRQGFPSLFIGISMHLGWDTFTHDNGWFVMNWALLRAPVGVFHLQSSASQYVWFISSVGGAAALLFCFFRYVKSRGVLLSGSVRGEWKRYMLWLGLIVIPAVIAWPITRHFVRVESHAGNYQAIFHIFAQYYLLSLCCVVLVLTWAVRLADAGQTASATGPSRT